MPCPDDKLMTPIYIKSRPDMPWPEEEKAFYVLSASGLFLCRNHPFFQSSVPAPHWPSELSTQRTFLELRYPRVPRKLFETIVGFFDRIGELHGSEAGVLLAWDRAAQRVRLIVPEQQATVSRSWFGGVYPIGLHYEVPTDLPAAWTIIGDVHSHVNEAAYASGTDKYDETYRAGLHLVVGRLYREPPELHMEAVVDGHRFPIEPAQVLEGYDKRRLRVPKKWLERVKVEPYPKKSRSYYGGSSYGGYDGNYSTGSGGSYAGHPRKRVDQAPRFTAEDDHYSRPKPGLDDHPPRPAGGDQP